MSSPFSPNPPPPSPAERIFAEFKARIARGESVDFEALCAQHAAIAPELRQLHADWVRLRSSAESKANSTADTFELISAYRHGRRDALDKLFARYYPRVLACVRARMGRFLRTKEQSVDLVQMAFAAAVESFDRFELREEGAFIHWLATVVENQIRGRVDYWKAKQRDPAREQQLRQISDSIASGEFVFEPVGRETTPLANVQADEISEIHEVVMGELSPDHREVLVLRRICELSLEETRKQMQRDTISATAMLQKRAELDYAKRLAKYLGDSTPA